jgi:hypothetical protein
MVNSRRMRLAGNVACMGNEKYTQNFGGKPEWKRPLRRPRYRCEDNIKMDLREIEWDGVDGIHLV